MAQYDWLREEWNLKKQMDLENTSKTEECSRRCRGCERGGLRKIKG